MKKNKISIDVFLDNNNLPEKINWTADEKSQEINNSKAMLLSFWDSQDKTALRLDLWTKDMMVDEMGDFFYQIFMTMGDTFKRANASTKLDVDIKEFAQSFYKKFNEEIKSK